MGVTKAKEVKIIDDITAAGEKIAERTCVLQLTIQRPTFRKRLKSDSFLERSGNNQEVDPEVLTVTQDLIERKELSDLRKVKKQLTRQLEGLEIPGGMLSLARGQYLIPVSRIEQVDSLIKDFEAKTNALLDVFEENYPQIIETAKQKRGGFFDENDYPTFQTIRDRFNHSYKFISNTVPAQMKEVSERLYEQENERIRAMCEATAIETREAIKSSFATLLEGLVENLTTKDGKDKKVSQSKIKKLTEFLNSFDALNITDDETLARYVQETKAIVSHTPTEKLQTDSAFRKVIQKSFSTVLEDVKASIGIKESRMIKLD